MYKLLSFALLASVISVGSSSFAADKMDSKVTTTHSTATKVDATNPANVTDTVTKTIETTKPVTAELSDGTKIEISGDNEVTAINADGTKNPAPDGVLTLKDGVTITVKGGKKVSQ